MFLKKRLLDGIAHQFPILKNLRKNEDGIAAIEFAFIAPIMIGLYFGMSEIAMGIMADRNVAHATAVTADLSSQLPTYDASQIGDVMTATVAVLGVPQNKLGSITVELSSYEMDTSGTVTRVGYARLGPTISSGGPATYDPSVLSAQMLNSQSGAVVARINDQYTPTTFKFMDNMTLSETLVMKPRKSITIPFDEGGVNSFNCSVGTDRMVSCSVATA